jgi:Ankyrin repeats (3 copies)
MATILNKLYQLLRGKTAPTEEEDSVHQLLNKLYRFDKKIKAHTREPEIATLDDIGFQLIRPLKSWTYQATPLNSSTFAHTGGDGDHFSFLHRDGKVTEESPVVMTVPMMFDEPNRIVGANLHEFLSLGCVVGYDAVTGLVYDFEGTVGSLFDYDKYVAESFSEEPTPEDLRDLATQKRLLDLLSKEFDLAPWPNPKKRLRELNKQWLSNLELRPQEEEEQDTPEVVALMKAVEKGETTVVRQLLKQGMNVNTRNRYGWTALHFAASYGQKNVVQVLLTHGANVNVAQDGGKFPTRTTPLMEAAQHPWFAHFFLNSLFFRHLRIYQYVVSTNLTFLRYCFHYTFRK